MINGSLALEKLLTLPFASVLDLGAGEGKHSLIFEQHDKEVTQLRYEDGDYVTQMYEGFDCIWACHVLEHCPNPGKVLQKCYSDLNEDGILAVTVPPLKHNIVGGHVTLWNAGLLLYQMILAGFDCRNASVKTYGYNISVIVRKRKAALPELTMGLGDVDRLAQFFPMNIIEGFDGNIGEVNW